MRYCLQAEHQEPIMTADFKFALYNFAGRPVKFFFAERVDLDAVTKAVEPEVSHHVLILDRSGSMYRDMAAVRTMTEKLLTLEEYRDSSVLVTLLSYSSAGSLTTHFSRRPVSEILSPGSVEVEAIRSIQAGGLTCMSQAIEEAMRHIVPGETTGISLHSDGYANDRSPGVERAALDSLAEMLEQMPSVFLNTIAYSPYSDFKLLSSLANRVSGVCVRTNDLAVVYDALLDTTKLLSQDAHPVLKIELQDADEVLFCSHAARRANLVAGDMVVRGLDDEHDRHAYRLSEVDAAVYSRSDSVVPIHEFSREAVALSPIYAYAMGALARGHINDAKFAMMATRDTELIREHYRALVNPELASMYITMQHRLGQAALGVCIEGSSEFGLGLDAVSVLEVCSYLSEHTDVLTLDLRAMQEQYTRRGVKRIAGSRNDDGITEKPNVTSRILGDDDAVSISSFRLNNANATINMLVSRPIELVDEHGLITGTKGEVLDEVAGIDVSDVKADNNYTVVGDGEVCIGQLDLKIDDKRVYKWLANQGVIKGVSSYSSGDYDAYTFYTLDLADLPVVDFDEDPRKADLANLFDSMVQVTTLKKILSAITKGRSSRFTEEQIRELEAAHLTPSLNYSPPTTKPFYDMKAAEDKGLIDHRVSYKVSLGNTDILELSQLHSGNKLLDRFVNVYCGGEKQKKPKWSMWLDADLKFEKKSLSARTKITPIDEAMRPILFDFLGLETSSALGSTVSLLSINDERASEFFSVVEDMVFRRNEVDEEDALEVFEDMLSACNDYLEKSYSTVRNLVFFVGATGLVPDYLDARAYDAEHLRKKYDRLKVLSAHEYATFFVSGRTIITVYAQDVRVSVDPGSRYSSVAETEES